MLRQIAHARGLIARAQEDPTYDLPKVWHAVSYCFTTASFSRNVDNGNMV